MRAASFAAMLSVLLTSMLFAGCGQKGPLFIPNDDTAPSGPAESQQYKPQQ